MSQKEFHPDLLKSLLLKAESEKRPPEVMQRLHWFLDFTENHSVSKVCSKFTIARSTYYRWLQRFDPSDLSTLEDNPTIPSVIPDHDPSDPIDHEHLYVGNKKYHGIVHSVPSVMKYTLLSVLFALFVNTGMLFSLMSGPSVQSSSGLQATFISPRIETETDTGSDLEIESIQQAKLSNCTKVRSDEWNCSVQIISDHVTPLGKN